MPLLGMPLTITVLFYWNYGVIDMMLPTLKFYRCSSEIRRFHSGITYVIIGNFVWYNYISEMGRQAYDQVAPSFKERLGWFHIVSSVSITEVIGSHPTKEGLEFSFKS